jgi:hypothetical protein
MLAPQGPVDTGQMTLNEQMDTCQRADVRTGAGYKCAVTYQPADAAGAVALTVQASRALAAAANEFAALDVPLRPLDHAGSLLALD